MAHGAGDAAAAAAEIQDPGVHLPAGQHLLGGVYQQLRVHPGDEHVRGHGHGQTVKLPRAGDVGHRLPGEAAAGQLLGLLLHPGGGVQGDIPQQLLHAFARSSGYQQPGFQIVALHAVSAQGVSGGKIDVVIGFQGFRSSLILDFNKKL